MINRIFISLTLFLFSYNAYLKAEPIYNRLNISKVNFDTLSLVAEIDLKSFPDDFFVSDSTLYFLSSLKNEILEFNVFSYKKKNDKSLSNAIKTYNNLYGYPIKIWVDNNNIYICFVKGMIILSKSTKEIKAHWYFSENAQYFLIVDSSILIYGLEKIYCYNQKGTLLKVSNLDEPLSQENNLVFENRLYISSEESIEKIDFNNGDVKREKIQKANINLSNLYLSEISKKYLICFNYYKRDEILFFDKNTHDVKRKINMSFMNLLPTKKQIELESGNPPLKLISYNEHLIFLVCSKNNHVNIYKITL